MFFAAVCVFLSETWAVFQHFPPEGVTVVLLVGLELDLSVFQSIICSAEPHPQTHIAYLHKSTSREHSTISTYTQMTNEFELSHFKFNIMEKETKLLYQECLGEFVLDFNTHERSSCWLYCSG